LKEFLERARKHKTEQFDQLKRELNYIEEDYQTLLEVMKSDSSNKIQESPTSELSENTNALSDFASEELINDSSLSKLQNSTLDGNTEVSCNSSSRPFDGNIPNCDQSSSSAKSPKFVPAFNSLAFGECSHTESIRKENEHKSESYINVRRKKMNFYFHELEKNYFNRCRKDAFYSKDSTTRLNEFKETLTKFTHFSNLRPLASLNYAKEYVVHNIVSSIEFDKDSEFFAIAGVAKKIKIFDYSAVVKDSLGINYPVNEIDCSSKISCLSWNSYYKAMMATSDYEGSVIIWDAFLGKRLTAFQEHEKRCWSVDFNKIDINLVASGSDDAKVKLWSANMDSSIVTLNSNANICSVKFNPKSLYHLAFGSADHRVYYYDLRNTRIPLTVFKEHRKAVSYVKFLNANELVSASTDSQIKLWNTEQSSCLKSYKGHINDKNFVGLTANDDYIACGSENNSLYVYYKGIERQMISFCFEKLIVSVSISTQPINNFAYLVFQQEKEETVDFVSAVCWRSGSNVLVAANSQGNIKVLLYSLLSNWSRRSDLLHFAIRFIL